MAKRKLDKDNPIYYIGGMKVVDGFDLKLERIKARMTITELSPRLGKSPGWISCLETGKIKLTPKLVKRYMEALSENHKAKAQEILEREGK